MSFWSAFVFQNLPDDERHKCYTLLREAHITAYEFAAFDVVLAETKHVGDPDEPGVGDIVPMTEIILRRINSLGGKVIFKVTRLTDSDIARLEEYATTETGKINFDEVYARVRREEGEERLLREREQET